MTSKRPTEQAEAIDNADLSGEDMVDSLKFYVNQCVH